MKGFAQRALVSDVLPWLRKQAVALEQESTPLHKLQGRVLASDVTAPIDVPSFDRSAMDGYALLADETEGASLYNPLTFILSGESLPGSAFDGQVTTGTAIRIMTGAPVPGGATCVVPAEHATESEGIISVSQAVPHGKHIGRRGEDIAAGQCLLTTGRSLRPQDVGLIASLGLAEVPAVRKPVVRLVVTGNELAQPGGTLLSGQIYESNSVMIASLVARDGGVLDSPPPYLPVPDSRDAIASELIRPGADLILVSGGSSVGTEDHAPSLVAELGTLDFHGIAVRPASPSGIGRINDTLVFLLPGNPVSCLCAYDLFAGEAIRRLGGHASAMPYPRQATQLAERITSSIGRVDYCRVQWTDASQQRVTPLAISGASILSSTTRADGFVIVPADLEGYPAGADIEVLLYDVSAHQQDNGP